MRKDLGEELDRVWEAFNLIYRLASRYVWVIYHEPYAQVNQVQGVLFPCFHKGLVSLFVAYELSVEGLYGPARPHMRHAFESLMIAKYCSLNPDADVFDRWIDGVDLYFTNAVIKKITRPKLIEIPELWKHLCGWTHSTVFAGQPNVAVGDAISDVRVNIGLIGVLLRCTYHLLSTHMLTPSVRYYGDRYADASAGDLPTKKLQEFFKWQYQYLGPGSKSLLKEYRATWSVV